MMAIDKCAHELFYALKNNAIPWHSFHEVGVDEDYNVWCYAESGLYMVKGVFTDAVCFVEASCPKKALEDVKSRFDKTWSEMNPDVEI